MGDNPTVRLDLDNEPQPDAVLLIDSQCGGQSSLSDDGYIEGAPELVVEIAASRATIDLRDKKRAYRRNGLEEYIVWQVSDSQFDWFVLEGGDYTSLTPNNNIIQSRIFPGLWLEVSALLAGDMAEVLKTLQTGLASPEHQNFQQKLIH